MQVTRAGGNIERLVINTGNSISIFDLLNAQKIVVEAGAMKYVEEFYGPGGAAAFKAAALAVKAAKVVAAPKVKAAKIASILVGNAARKAAL